MRAIKINVTKEHIRRGVRRSMCDCPIALALKEALLTKDVSVTSSQMIVNHLMFMTDLADARFIKGFDEGKTVRPYSFSLRR